MKSGHGTAKSKQNKRAPRTIAQAAGHEAGGDNEK
jgi:hypothetical protein